jgi:tagatose 6-phosphate kinase
MILVVGQNSVWQKLCLLPRLERGEVNRVREVREYASGKGVNAARALSSMGAAALVLGYAGGRHGRSFANAAYREGIRGDWTAIKAETRICTTYAEEDGLSTEVIEPTPRVSAAEKAAFLRAFRRRVDRAAFLIISGTTTDGESEDCYSTFICEAHRRGVPVLLDSACAAAERALSEGPEILKVNLRELAQLTGGQLTGLPGRIEAYRKLMAGHGIRWIVMTDGAQGMEGFDGERLLRATPPRVRPVKTIGSGDAAAAGMALSMLERIGGDAHDPRTGLEQALVMATAMGTASCLNAIGGRVENGDFLSLKNNVSVREITAPP